jgi:hypothetical protein
MGNSELIFFPSPGIGHLVSIVEMAKILITRNKTLSVTILIMKFQINTKIDKYIQSFSWNSSNSATNKIEFIDLPTPDLSSLAGVPMMTFLSLYIESHKPFVRDIVAGKLDSGDNRIVGLVIDMFCTSMIDVANEFGLPTYVFFSSSASFLSLNFHVQSLVDDENIDLMSLVEKDGGDDLYVPGFVNRVPFSVLPLFLSDEDGATELLLSQARRFRETKGIMVNTFRELEAYAIESLENEKNPPIYPVGPILNLDRDEDDSDIIEWLDQQPESSVVFLCFGSMGTFEEEQVKEIAKALERSEQRFLWSLRRPVEKGKIEFPGEFSDPNEILPNGFLERTKEIGKVVGWAPQVSVLSHRSVGRFVSHCGWNSTLESVWCGVPLATWPMFAEQNINAFQFVKELGSAVEIKMDYKKEFMSNDGEIVSAELIESGIRKLMEDDKESEVRKKVKEMKAKSRAAVSEGGSSYKTIDLFIQKIMS